MAGRAADVSAAGPPAAAARSRPCSQRFSPGRTLTADNDDRRARPELARAGRADDGAGGGLPGHRRRGAVRVGKDGWRPRGAHQAAGGRRGAASRDRRSRSTSRPGTAPGRRGRSDGPACRPGSCRWLASSCSSRSTASSTSSRCRDRSSSRPTIRATSIRRRSCRPCRPAGGIGWRRRWPRSSSRRTSFPSNTAGRPGPPTARTITSPHCSSTRSPFRSGKQARGRRCDILVSWLRAGYSVLIFPEGRRTADGSIGGFQPGTAMIAARLGVPVVPVRLEGLDRILHQSWKFPVRGPARVTFGAPSSLEGTRLRRCLLERGTGL